MVLPRPSVGERVPHRNGDGRDDAALPDKEFMTTLAKGLAVLSAFGEQRPHMTLSQAAEVADLSRATARRILLTLSELGYVEQDGRAFSLSPKILDLGFAYLNTQSWIDRTAPLLRELSDRLGENCSAAILQDNEIVYVARCQAPRIMSAVLSVGSRLPALHSSMGRVLLGFLAEDELWRRLKAMRIEPYTQQTITGIQPLFDRIRDDRLQGFSIVDEELERGLLSIAVPILDRHGNALGAINVSTHASRTTRNEMRMNFLPELKRVSAIVSQKIGT